ncbi:MAG: hypothetical protein RQ753_04480 [Desulfurivibrionaceae bacterium]|nr:hypothetical protein [Desulfobulbales bacterium]MDT8334932.1 hypothetical protein [Desulfurivibrionaceae bacterium]
MKKEDLEKMVGKVKQRRDELKVKLHLGKTEAEKEWKETEKKWQQLKPKFDSISATGSEIAKELGTTMKQLGDDIMKGYDKLGKILKK